MGPLIFVVDGLSERRKFVHEILEQAGYQVESFATTRALEAAEQCLPAFMIIGVELPDGNGIVMREKIRGNTALASTPVLLLADGRVERYRDVIHSNPEEYLTFPFTPGELIRRLESRFPSVREGSRWMGAELFIDTGAMKIFIRGKEVQATALEFRLLDYMARHRGKVFTRDALLDAVWGDLQFVTPRSVDACIRRIRRKIEVDPASPQLIQSVRGIGYKLDGNAAWETRDACHCRMCTAVQMRSKAVSERLRHDSDNFRRAASCN